MMGVGPFNRTCSTNPSQPAPNPDPSRWELLDKAIYDYGYVLRVRYLDCTNLEGEKILVFRGFPREHNILDPHFCDHPDSPIARFYPDDYGWHLANELAKSF